MFGIRKAATTFNQYYFYWTNNKFSVLDEEVSDLLDITTDDYRNLMICDYNAIRDRRLNQIRFVGKNNAENALSYINSILTMSELSKVEKT